MYAVRNSDPITIVTSAMRRARCGGVHTCGRATALMAHAAAGPSAELEAAMIAPPTVTATNERAKLVWNATARSAASETSSTATTTDRDGDRDVVVGDQERQRVERRRP